MNGSMYTADRTTHLKIVVTGLVIALFVAGFGITARLANPGDEMFVAKAPTVYVPHAPVAANAGSLPVVR